MLNIYANIYIEILSINVMMTLVTMITVMTKITKITKITMMTMMTTRNRDYQTVEHKW